jgi:hypothetical protein
MKMQTTAAVAAIAMLCGVSAASAADVASSHGAMAMKASDSLNLTAVQQKTAWNDLSKQTTQSAPANFNGTAGSKVPNTLSIKAVPSKTARDVAALRPFDFAKIRGKVLIVNPTDRKVAEVITG